RLDLPKRKKDKRKNSPIPSIFSQQVIADLATSDLSEEEDQTEDISVEDTTNLTKTAKEAAMIQENPPAKRTLDKMNCKQITSPNQTQITGEAAEITHQNNPIPDRQENPKKKPRSYNIPAQVDEHNSESKLITNDEGKT
ncbi:hypothetical protein ACJMK2_022443, partial [Sinanodonta woodiana]